MRWKTSKQRCHWLRLSRSSIIRDRAEITGWLRQVGKKCSITGQSGQHRGQQRAFGDSMWFHTSTFWWDVITQLDFWEDIIGYVGDYSTSIRKSRGKRDLEQGAKSLSTWVREDRTLTWANLIGKGYGGRDSKNKMSNVGRGGRGVIGSWETASEIRSIYWGEHRFVHPFMHLSFSVSILLNSSITSLDLCFNVTFANLFYNCFFKLCDLPQRHTGPVAAQTL